MMLITPGLVGMHAGRNCNRPPLSVAFWLQPISLIGLGCTHDSADTASMNAIHKLVLDGMTESGFQRPPFHLALRMDDQSLP